MFSTDWTKLIPVAYIYSAFGLSLAILAFVIRTGTRNLLSQIKSEWAIVTARLERIEDVQGVQAGNHLQHIQANGEKTVEILEGMRQEQAETTGYLRAIASKLEKS